MTSSQPEDLQLVERCRDGSVRHQKRLYERYAPQMMGLCMRYAGSEAEAEDMLQEGFVTVFRKLEQFTGKGPLGAWIRKIILNAALMHYRRHKKHLQQVDLAELEFALDNGEDIFSQLSARELMENIQQLPAGYRVVFNLFAVEGYSHKEIAEQLGVTEGTSKSQYSRARHMLRKMIEQEQKLIRGTIS